MNSSFTTYRAVSISECKNRFFFFFPPLLELKNGDVDDLVGNIQVGLNAVKHAFYHYF